MLTVVATPIGNLDDLGPRAVEAFRRADIVACEDTRRTRVLMSRFDIARPARMVSYREQTERRAGPRLVESLRGGAAVVLCSDGGYPGVSDPGYRLIRLAVDAGVPLEVIPGPSAVPVALLMSGLSTSSYTFKGYPPRKPGALRRFFAAERDLPHTLVVFESPLRVLKTLQGARAALGDRAAAVCIELTKKFERVHRGYLSELAAEFEGKPVKGEVTVVIAGNNPKFARPAEAANTPLGEDRAAC